MKLYNTATGRVEPFEPQEPGHARIYVCGPTVYDLAHLGHARCYVIYDMLVRHLRNRGLKVTYVRNITDVDDKILARAKERGENPIELAARFTKEFHADMERLGNIAPDIEPKVSEHIDEIQSLIRTLIDNGHAYQVGADVYFSVESYPDYGKLSNRKLDDMKAGASERVSVGEQDKKKHAADFALWKGDEDGWESPWGNGRPGWHIECSAMSMKHLGPTLDLHGGGLDLVFPHHENECAQSECATHKPYAKTWMHNGFVEVDKQKMGKSLGNFFTARDLFKRVEPEAIRYAMLTMHYRAPLNFNWTLDEDGHVTGFPQLEEAEGRVSYIYNTLSRLREIPEGRVRDLPGEAPAVVNEIEDRLLSALDDDLNMPIALAHLAEFLKVTNELVDRALAKKGKIGRDIVEAVESGFRAVHQVLGIAGEEPSAFLHRVRDRNAAAMGIEPEMILRMIGDRNGARHDKNFARADEIRDELVALGIVLKDSPNGTDWVIEKTGSDA